MLLVSASSSSLATLGASIPDIRCSSTTGNSASSRRVSSSTCVLGETSRPAILVPTRSRSCWNSRSASFSVIARIIWVPAADSSRAHSAATAE